MSTQTQGGDECIQSPVAEQRVEGRAGTKVNFEGLAGIEKMACFDRRSYQEACVPSVLEFGNLKVGSCIVLAGGLPEVDTGGVGMGQITKGLRGHSKEVDFFLESTGSL